MPSEGREHEARGPRSLSRWCEPELLTRVLLRLRHDDAEGSRAGRKRGRRGRQLGQVAARDGEDADGVEGGVDDVQTPAAGVETGVEGTDAGATLERRAGQGLKRRV